MKIRLILADDHPTLLSGIQHELARIPTLSIVGMARNSTQLIEWLNREACDIAIIDFAMPGGDHGDGMSLLQFMRRRYPDLKIIVFTMNDNPAIIQQIARLGIELVVSKTDEIGHLVSAIHAVYAGAPYYSPSAHASTGREQDLVHMTHTRVPETRQLTIREAEVLRLYVAGQSINEIAAQLKRSKKTISTQKNQAMRKLGITRNADLFRFVYEAGGDTTPDGTGNTPSPASGAEDSER